jgi:hypothetical protein
MIRLDTAGGVSDHCGALREVCGGLFRRVMSLMKYLLNESDDVEGARKKWEYLNTGESQTRTSGS